MSFSFPSLCEWEVPGGGIPGDGGGACSSGWWVFNDYGASWWWYRMLVLAASSKFDACGEDWRWISFCFMRLPAVQSVGGYEKILKIGGCVL
jgi:hypothetical protein